MSTHSNSETHLSKDELMEILNEIDTEQHVDRKTVKDNPKENLTHHHYPNPNNPFY